MYKEEIAGIIIAFVFYILSYYSYLENIEFLQVASTFLAGAFTTYTIQHRLQVESEKRRIKRENDIIMRDKIYGPIFREMNKGLESVGSALRPGWEVTQALEKTMNHYLFHKIEPSLKGKLRALLDRFDKYDTIHHATLTMVLRAIKDVVNKTHNIDISVQVGVVRLRLELQDMTVDEIYLEQALLQEMIPAEFVRTVKDRWGENTTAEVSISGTKKTLRDFELLYEAVLNMVRQEQLFQEEKKQRKILKEELEAFLEQIKPHVGVA